jgi:hypothetical protein
VQVGKPLNASSTHPAFAPQIATVAGVPWVAWEENSGSGASVRPNQVRVAQYVPPACVAGSLAVRHDGVRSVSLSCSDGSAPRVLTGPTHGTLSAIDRRHRNLVYTPAIGFAGSDSFTYTGNDGAMDAPGAIVTLSVAPAPVPRLTRLSITKSFAAAASGPSLVAQLPVVPRRAVAIGGQIRFTLDRAARVWFVVQVPDGATWVTLPGRFSTIAPAGPSRLLFTGRVRRRRLAPGSYRLVAWAAVTERGAPVGAPVETGFQIVTGR